MKKILLPLLGLIFTVSVQAATFTDGKEYISLEKPVASAPAALKEGANKRGNSSRLTQSFHFFMFEPIFSPVNALNQPI